MISPAEKFSAIILAGGKGRRVNGQDKGLIEYNNKTLIKHVIDAVTPLSHEIVISANRNIAAYEDYGYPVITDADDDYRGPLAGIAAALQHCSNNYVFITPCDMPLLTSDVFRTIKRRH